MILYDKYSVCNFLMLSLNQTGLTVLGITEIFNFIPKNCQPRQSWEEIHSHHLLILGLQRYLCFLAFLAFRVKTSGIVSRNNLHIISNKDVTTIYQSSVSLKLLYKSQITTEVTMTAVWLNASRETGKQPGTG